MIAVYYKKLILEAKDKGKASIWNTLCRYLPDRNRKAAPISERDGWARREVVAELWKNDRLFACTMKWVLTLNDSNIKLAVLDMLRAVGDGERRRVMKIIFCAGMEPDEVKMRCF